MPDIIIVITNICISIPGFLLGITFHEAAHALVAYKCGDDTAKRLGRMTLNPVPHIDLMGTIILPIIFATLGGVMFGWAKPVPIDSRRFKEIKKSIFWVSFAGPLANFILVIIFSFLYAVLLAFVAKNFYFYAPLKQMLHSALAINVVLGVFNLIPLPPLDGSKMVTTFLSYELLRKYEVLSHYSFPIMIVLMITGAFGYIIYPFLVFGEWLVKLFYVMLV